MKGKRGSWQVGWAIILIGYLSLSLTAQNLPAPQASPIVKNSAVKDFPVQEGVYDHSFRLSNGERWPVLVSVPSLQPGEEVPLVLALHWAGNEEAYREYGRCLSMPGTAGLRAIVIIPSAEGKHWVHPHVEERVVRFVRQAVKYWPVDKDRVMVTGYSNGGIGSWEYASKYPRLFSAAIPMAGTYQPAKTKIPLVVIHGERDELFPEHHTQAAVASSTAGGKAITYRVIPDLSHYMGCAYVAALRDAVSHVQKQVW